MMKLGKLCYTAEGVIDSGVSSCLQQRGPSCETCVGRVSFCNMLEKQMKTLGNWGMVQRDYVAREQKQEAN